MKKIYIIILLITSIIVSTSCENFRDNNGELGGQWQLTQWRTLSSSNEIDSLVANNLTNDTTLANKHKIYLCIHRDVFQIQDASHFYNKNFFCSFVRSENTIELKNIVDTDGNLLVDANQSNHSYADFAEYGIPEDGKFNIDILEENTLQLSFKDNILCFRKY